MSLARIVTAPLWWPLVWAWALLVGALAGAADLLATPWVRARRRRRLPADEAPRSRDASVIVLNYDGRAFLEELLPSLEAAVAATPGDHEIIVVDNGSRDGSAQLVRERFPRMRLVELPENRFFIRGNRAGVEVATRDVLVFVNNDMRVERDFLRRLLERLDAPDVFAVTGNIEMTGRRLETGRTRGEFRRGALRLVQVEGPDDGGRVPALWAGGGNSAFDRAKYLELGGFEDLYEPCYAEDLSLSWRAWRRGWRVEHAPGATVHHLARGTSERVFSRAGVERLDRRNRELMFWRGVTDPVMALSHLVWLPWNVYKDARHTGLPVQLVALLAALPRMPRALLLRQETRASARRGDRELLRLGCSVPEYRRQFSPRAAGPVRVLSVGCGVPSGAIEGLQVQVATVASHGGARADELRELLRERDHDVVLFRDGATLEAVPGHVPMRPAVLCLDGREAEGMGPRALKRLARRAGVVAMGDAAVRERLRAIGVRVIDARELSAALRSTSEAKRGA